MEGKSKKGQIEHEVLVHVEKIKDKIEGTDLVVNKDEFEKLLEVTPFKYKDATCVMVMDTLFEVAKEKMVNPEDQKVLDKLRKLVQCVERNLYDPTPRYIDCMFFPDPSGENVTRMCEYILKAVNTLKVCVFNFTNNEIRDAVFAVHKKGVKVQIITDDQCMKNLGSDIQWLAD